MPLLESNQIRHICASVRLDEATAAQVDQYAAFIQSSAADVVDKALNYVFSRDRDFQEFLKTPQASRLHRLSVFGRLGTIVRPSRPERRLQPVWNPRIRRGWSRRDQSSYFVAMQERCFAPEEFRHSIPGRVAFGTCTVPFGNKQKDRELGERHDFRGSIWNRERKYRLEVADVY